MAKINSIGNTTEYLTVDSIAASDSYIQFDLIGVSAFRIGVDQTDDSFCLSLGNALGTNNRMTIDTTGNVRIPLQPAVLTYDTDAHGNVSGDGTSYSIPASAEIFDQGGDYSSPNFTAPATGIYFFQGNSILVTTPAGGGNYFYFALVTSNRTYYCSSLPTLNRVANFYGNGGLSITSHVMADMDSADTAYFKIVSVGGAKTDDLQNEVMNYYLIG